MPLGPSTNPLSRRETRLFSQIGQGAGRTKVYRPLKYALVSYDGDPTSYIEPLSVGGDAVLSVMNGQFRPNVPSTSGYAQISGAQFLQGRPFPAFAYDDVDLAGLGWFGN